MLLYSQFLCIYNDCLAEMYKKVFIISVEAFDQYPDYRLLVHYTHPTTSDVLLIRSVGGCLFLSLLFILFRVLVWFIIALL